MANVHSISINNELEEYLVNNPNLSLSKIMQSALYNLKENTQDLKNEIKVLQNKCKVMQDKIFELQND